MFKSVWWLCNEVLSAKSSHIAVIYNGRPLMYSENNMGPRTEP